MTLSLCTSVALLLSAHSALGSVVTNVASSGFQRWPSNIIYYSVDQPPYGINNNLKDLGNLKQAMQQVSVDMGYCVNFTQWQPSLGNVPRVVFQSSFSSPSTPNAMCFTYPGYYPAGGANGQIATVFGSAAGNAAGNCMDNPRDAMKFIVNLMGLQNEWQRQDRDTYLTGLTGTPNDPNTLVSSTLQQYQLFSQPRKYTAAQATSQGSDFDYNSITMVTGGRYAASQSQPVFTLANGKTTWQQARLSKGDCTALTALYSCPITGFGLTPSCDKLPDPSSTSAVSFSASQTPSIITRSVQCATPGSTTNPPFVGPVNLGSFLITGVGTEITVPQPQIDYTPKIEGLEVRSFAHTATGGVLTVADSGIAVQTDTCATAPCFYMARFRLTAPLAKSYNNQQITVTITTTGANNVQTAYPIPVTLNLNCAPQWQSATVYQIGATAALAVTQTKTAGTGINAINPATGPTTAPTAGTISVPTAGAADTPKYLVNNIVEFGATGNLGTGTPPVTKAFVNCNGAISDKTGGALIGANILGQVSAVDPDGGRVTYYAWSGATTFGTDKSARTSVSPDGIVTLAVPQAALVGTVEASLTTPNKAASAGTGAALTGATQQIIYITATDPSGGSSTLEMRLWAACGPTS